MSTLLGSGLGMLRAQYRDHWREVARDDLPDDIDIDIQVIMNNPMAHADVAMPWNPWT